MAVVIDPSWHPLIDGYPPRWASGWGQDEYGVFCEFTVEEVTAMLRWMPAGRFLMGSPEDEAGYQSLASEHDFYKGRESPQTEITFLHGFWMAETPVTQALYEVVTGENPSEFKSPERPVEQVSWEDAQAFIQKLNGLIEGLNVRLPSEAAWEYACRAGTTAATYAGPMEILGKNNAPVLDAIAWYGGNSGVGFDLKESAYSGSWGEKQYEFDKCGSRLVKQKKPNPWGLYDTLGNVFEWCADTWHGDHEGALPDGSARLSSKPDGVSNRVVRGGSWIDSARHCRAAYRGRYEPGYRFGDIGFRLSRGQVS